MSKQQKRTDLKTQRWKGIVKCIREHNEQLDSVSFHSQDIPLTHTQGILNKSATCICIRLPLSSGPLFLAIVIMPPNSAATAPFRHTVTACCLSVRPAVATLVFRLNLSQSRVNSGTTFTNLKENSVYMDLIISSCSSVLLSQYACLLRKRQPGATHGRSQGICHTRHSSTSLTCCAPGTEIQSQFRNNRVHIISHDIIHSCRCHIAASFSDTLDQGLSHQRQL